jgi:hypothetical protein
MTAISLYDKDAAQAAWDALNDVQNNSATESGSEFVADNETVRERAKSDISDPADTPEWDGDRVSENTFKGLYLASVLALNARSYTVVQLAAFTTQPNEGTLVRCSDGAYGTPCIAIRSGSNWLRADNGLEVREDPYHLLQPPTYLDIQMPNAVGNQGKMIYVINGAAGQPVMAFSDNLVWRRCDDLGLLSVV